MKILSRHIVRAMLGPFFFALSALTGILFLNAVASQMDNLSGKGLGWDVILEFLLLTLPHTLALTLPMAVLVAVLQACSEMTAANELTAMKAGGVSPWRIMRPLLGLGIMAAATVWVFNDQILPEANHRLKNLLQDINRKSPTFVLREQAVNRLESGLDRKTFDLVAAKIDNQTSMLHDVRVVDQNNPRRHTVTWADSARIALSENRVDLQMVLYDGISFQTNEYDPSQFERTEFEAQQLQFEGIGDEFERGTSAQRTERELTVAYLQERARTEDQRREELVESVRLANIEAVRGALGLPLRDSALVAGLEGTERVISIAIGISRQNPSEETSPLATFDRLTSSIRGTTQNSIGAVQLRRNTARRLRVEVHKKGALAFACIVFVILGTPLAARVPTGGLGLVIGASTAIFSVYYIGLIGGENLADAGRVPPVVAMWGTNLIFLAIGAWLFSRMGNETSTTRGGGLEEIGWRLRRPLRALRARRSRVEGGSA
ncbi:MAG: LptF/LptG family permease [Longimicrobiales bacterium]|nr:LptF/LptG family permease [Longimicrobiales bacterium]